jgi:CBS domain-containing protein
MVLVQDVMTRDPISVPQDASVDVAIDLMVENNVSGVPVVDQDNLPVGLITEYDVLQLYGKYHGDCPTRYLTCSDTMTTDIRTIRQDASLEVAAKIFQAASLRRLLVLDGKQLAGILSRRDVVRSIRDGRLNPVVL